MFGIHSIFVLIAIHSAEEAESEPQAEPPIDAYLLVDSRQVGELHITIPADWKAFEFQINDWTPVDCPVAQECAVLSVFAPVDCESIPIRLTVQTEKGVNQYWQNISCVNVPIQSPSLRGEGLKNFASPRRKWR